MNRAGRIGCTLLLCFVSLTVGTRAADPEGVLRVKATDDFEVTGDGKNAAWAKTEWVAMPQRSQNGVTYETKFKLLYSPKGIYILFDAADKTLTTTGRKDFEKLWEEDVFEAFFWTDERHALYFEYEISPLGFELPILVPNVDGGFLGWRPWQYEGNRKIRKATTVTGGNKEAGATVTGWTAEVFVPYELLNPLKNVPPRSGTQWRANFYRMDYDGGKHNRWTWVPVGQSFHEYQKFGKLVFE